MAFLWWVLMAAVLAAATWWFLHRDPERVIQRFDGYLSPADGVVGAVYDVSSDKKKLPKGAHGITAFLDDFPGAAHIIVIVMQPQHVHVQRSPVTGRVRSVVRKPGTLRNAVFGDWRRSTVENEHVSFNIAGERPCKVYLIAGLLARRIVPVVKEGDHLVQGARLGSIRFGSQVALVLPKSEVLVAPGDRVYGGLTEVAR